MILGFFVFMGGWFILVGAQPASLIVAVPTCLLASFSYQKLAGSKGQFKFDIVAATAFIPYFIVQTLAGTFNVGRLALDRQASRRHGVCYEYRTRLQQPGARLFFFNCISVLPGTLVVAIRPEQDNCIVIHSIDDVNLGQEELIRCENKVAAIFKETLGETPCT